MRSIYSYRDYRQYLADFYSARKTESSGYSYAIFAKAAGLGSANYPKLVMDGRRNLTISNIHQFAQTLGLKGDEYDYFESLVLFNQASEPGERSFYLSRLTRIRKSKPSRKEVLSAHPLIGRWYYPAVLLCLHDCDPESAAMRIRRETGLSKLEADQALATVEDMKLASLVNGRYKLNYDQLTIHDRKHRSLMQKTFIAEQIECSRKAFEAGYDRQEAKFITHTMTAPLEMMEVLHQKILTLLEEFTREVDLAYPGSGECRVVQVNGQLFPSALNARI